jgi:hypothetical protein
MKKHGPTGQYGAFNGSFQKPNSFASTDDYLAFIKANLAHLRKEADLGHLAHGRGIVLLKPRDGLIQSWFITCDRTDIKGMRPDARRDYDEYDLATECLVGVMSAEEPRFQFWRWPERRAIADPGKDPQRTEGK